MSFLFFLLTLFMILTLGQSVGNSFFHSSEIPLSGLNRLQILGSIKFELPMQLSFTLNCKSFNGGITRVMQLSKIPNRAPAYPLIYAWKTTVQTQLTNRRYSGGAVNVMMKDLNLETNTDYKFEYFFYPLRVEIILNGIKKINQDILPNNDLKKWYGESFKIDAGAHYKRDICFLKNIGIRTGALPALTTTPKPTPKSKTIINGSPFLKKCIAECYYYDQSKAGNSYPHVENNKILQLALTQEKTGIFNKINTLHLTIIFCIAFVLSNVVWFIKLKRKEKELKFDYSAL